PSRSTVFLPPARPFPPSTYKYTCPPSRLSLFPRPHSPPSCRPLHTQSCMSTYSPTLPPCFLPSLPSLPAPFLAGASSRSSAHQRRISRLLPRLTRHFFPSCSMPTSHLPPLRHTYTYTYLPAPTPHPESKLPSPSSSLPLSWNHFPAIYTYVLPLPLAALHIHTYPFVPTLSFHVHAPSLAGAPPLPFLPSRAVMLPPVEAPLTDGTSSHLVVPRGPGRLPVLRRLTSRRERTVSLEHSHTYSAL
ncbi:hypothetical protein C8J57DRAFT_1549514, partial [Mycena rebaudengoi]